jgi:hypothetical protein
MNYLRVVADGIPQIRHINKSEKPIKPIRNVFLRVFRGCNSFTGLQKAVNGKAAATCDRRRFVGGACVYGHVIHSPSVKILGLPLQAFSMSTSSTLT